MTYQEFKNRIEYVSASYIRDFNIAQTMFENGSLTSEKHFELWQANKRAQEEGFAKAKAELDSTPKSERGDIAVLRT